MVGQNAKFTANNFALADRIVADCVIISNATINDATIPPTAYIFVNDLVIICQLVWINMGTVAVMSRGQLGDFLFAFAVAL